MYTHLTHIFEDSVVVFSVADALFGFWCKANDGEENFVPPVCSRVCLSSVFIMFSTATEVLFFGTYVPSSR